MSERDESTQALIAALSGDDADAALIAWTTLSHGWEGWPAVVQQSAIAKGLSSRQTWTASAARRFITDRWDELGQDVQSTALDTLGTLLDDEDGAGTGQASTVWTFFADHFERLPRAFEAVLTTGRFAATFAHADVAADAWDFLTAHWDRLPPRLKAVVAPRDVAAALDSPKWRVVVAGWDFLVEHWPSLEKQLHDVLSAERIAAAALDPIGRIAVEEFASEHAATLPPELCLAARKTTESRKDP